MCKVATEQTTRDLNRWPRSRVIFHLHSVGPFPVFEINACIDIFENQKLIYKIYALHMKINVNSKWKEITKKGKLNICQSEKLINPKV